MVATIHFLYKRLCRHTHSRRVGTREHINTDALIACAAGAIQTCQTTEGAFKRSVTPFEIIILFLMVGEEGDRPREE